MRKLQIILIVLGIAVVIAFMGNPRQNWAQVKRGLHENFDPRTRP